MQVTVAECSVDLAYVYVLTTYCQLDKPCGALVRLAYSKLLIKLQYNSLSTIILVDAAQLPQAAHHSAMASYNIPQLYYR
jgi:hypothetical protein